jgi:phage gp16-like protein
MLLHLLQNCVHCFSLKEGKEILPNNERIKIVTDKAEKGFYELVIADVLNEDAGKYSCTATNKYGEASCEATVTVTSKLMFIIIATINFKY